MLDLALTVGADGDPTVAATLHGVADEQYDQAGRAVATFDAPPRDRDQAQLRVTLGDAAFEAAYRHGRTLSQADGIALDAVPDPVNGLLIYRGGGGGAGAREPRRPQPAPSSAAVSLPGPADEPYLDLAAAHAVSLPSGS